ncbi:MAG TPA: preprotein translocase subunit SecE [Thermoleophilaceae bacterium]|nr:preprotein translocase subunit SecE [Thermoleophilaceae bacterium]
MARNRQRAKQRQAERRAERLGRTRAEPSPNEEALHEVELYTGAPPEDTGRSDTVTESPPPAPEFEGDDEDLEEPIDAGEEFEPALETGDGAGTPPAGRRVARGRGEPHHERRHHRNRLIAFLIAVWAELQRVEWPDRQTLTTLTGVVLLFVVIMGAYLGLLDAIWSRLINKIL